MNKIALWGIIMDEYKMGAKTTWITVFMNIFLAVFKIASGIIGNSKAMLADGIHTLSDVFATFIVLFGLKISTKEADENHPYGHERYEPVFAKLVSVILILTGFFIGLEGIKSLLSKNIRKPDNIALIAAFVSILVKEGMYWFTIKTAKKIKSLSMEASAWHHRSDAISSVGTFVGIFGARLGFKILDPVAAVIVSVLIIKVGIDIYAKSVRGLVDEAADRDIIKKVRKMALSVEGVKNIKNLKTRIFASKIYVDIEITVDGNLTVVEGHNIAERVHDLIEDTIGDVKHCMVHVEPDIEYMK